MGTVANMAGFPIACGPVLAASYVLILAALVPFAVRVVGARPAAESEPAVDVAASALQR